jgi:hypothetical protein
MNAGKRKKTWGVDNTKLFSASVKIILSTQPWQTYSGTLIFEALGCNDTSYDRLNCDTQHDDSPHFDAHASIIMLIVIAPNLGTSLSGLYYKHVTIINDDSSVISKLTFKLIATLESPFMIVTGL